MTKMVHPVNFNDASLKAAVATLKKGGLVAFPTETVYGLGADASNPEAVAKIFQAKNRPADHPLIVHIGSLALLPKWAKDIPDFAFELAKHFWPGPLAMILAKQDSVSDVVTGGQPTVAVRMPNHPVALQLLQSFGGGLAAPSANRFKHISPTCANHVVEELGDKVDMIIDGGNCDVGIESTIIDLTQPNVQILRPGEIRPEQIEQILKQPVEIVQASEVRASGMMEVHYAPVTPAFLCEREIIKQWMKKATRQNKKIGVLTYSLNAIENENIRVCQLSPNPHEYGHELYAALRELDASHPDRILVEKTPDLPEWGAINDRLNKATVIDKT